MIDTVIFDIGNVLVEFLPNKYVVQFTEDEETASSLIRATFGHPVWQELDRGTVEEEAAIAIMMKDTPEYSECIKKMFVREWGERMLKPMPRSMEFLQELKTQGYKLYMLSNYHRDTFKYITRTYKEFDLFDGGVISWQVHANKPEPKIYQCLIDKYSLNPRECIFIDDMQANLDGAAKFGISTILFKDINQVRKDLAAVTGKVF